MNKIPVGKTIASAYDFLFHEIGVIIGIAWLPAVIYALGDAATYVLVQGGTAATGADEAAMIARNSPVLLGALLASLIARTIVSIGITKQVLGLRSGNAFVYLPFDRTGLRMLLANLRFVLGIVVLLAFAFFVTVIAFMLAGVPLDNPEQVQPTVASTIAAFLGLSLFVYAGVAILRMGFLLPSVVVAETKSGLKRAHALLHGNFWRMLIVLAVLGFPILALFVGGEFAVMRSALGPDFLDRPDVDNVMSLAEQAIRQQIVAWEIFNAVLFVLGSGLIYSGAAYAYRALVPGGRSIPQRDEKA